VYLIGMKWFKLGRGSAVSWIFLVILLVFAMLLVSRFKSRELTVKAR
jgi:ABC-type sugar transport system permease subunit